MKKASKQKLSRAAMATLRNTSTPGCFPTYTYDVFFYTDTISTTVTADPAVVTQWITEVKSIHSAANINLVGFDTKSVFPYGPGPNRTATVQLCIGNRCLIYQIFHTPYKPRALLEFFIDPKYVFAAFGIDLILTGLLNDYEISPLFSRTQRVEVAQWAARIYGNEVGNSGLQALARVVLEKEVDRPQSMMMSAWNAWRLTPEQVQYACVDAFVPLQIAKALADTRQQQMINPRR